MTKEFIDLPASTTDSILTVPTIGDLPTQGLVPGAVLYVESVGTIYVSDGVGWAPVSGSGAPVPASSVTNVPAGSISATNVQAAINELDSEKISSTRSVSAGSGLTGGGDLSADRTISMPATGTPGTYGSSTLIPVITTDAQGRVSSVTTAALGAVAASAVTNVPAGTISATNVQAALNELDTEKTPTTRLVSAGTGLSGGGDLSADRTISMPAVGTAGTYGSASSVPVVTTDAQGRVTAATPTPIAITSAAVTDFTEAAQDAVGAALTDTASVDFTYNDAGNTISAAVLPGGVDHNSLSNYVADQHVAHSTVSISAGTGLTGGGTIAANRTISMPATGTPGTYTSVTTDTQGRVTAGSNPTTLAGYGITDAQPLDGDLTAVAGLSSTGLIARTAANTMATRTVTAGTGLSVSNGDGVSGDPTVSITASGVTASTYGSATQVSQVAINASGQATSATNVSIAIPSTQVTDFTEAAQDAVGGALTDTASVDFTYNDAGNTITAVVLPAGVDHNSLSNFVANKHIDHSAVSISAGTGLTGGGDITANRTISMPAVGTAGTYGAANSVSIITTDTQGRVSTITSTAIAILAAAVTDFAAAVRAVVLTGLSTATNSAIAATDTVLVAFGKLQAQINARPANWIQYRNSAVQTTTQNNTSLTAITVDTDTDSVLGSSFTKFSATELQTNFAGYVRVTFKVGAQNTSSNNRSARVGIIKNGTILTYTYALCIGQTNANRYDTANGSFIIPCANGDKFQVGMSNAEAITDTISIAANDAIFTIDVRSIT